MAAFSSLSCSSISNLMASSSKASLVIKMRRVCALVTLTTWPWIGDKWKKLLSLTREIYLLMSWDPTNLSLISSAELILSEKLMMPTNMMNSISSDLWWVLKLGVEAPGSDCWEAMRSHRQCGGGGHPLGVLGGSCNACTRSCRSLVLL